MEKARKPLLVRIKEGLFRFFKLKNKAMDNETKPARPDKKVNGGSAAAEAAPAPEAVKTAPVPDPPSSPAQAATDSYLLGQRQAAEAHELAASAAKAAAEMALDGKQGRFKKAEDAVDAYELVTSTANLLAKNMEALALEVDRNAAVATEAAKSVLAANAGAQQAKAQLATADDTAAKLWDTIRRDLNKDPNVELLRASCPNLNAIVEDYSKTIQKASDHMNNALTAASGKTTEIKTDEIRRKAQSAKSLADGYHKQVLADLGLAMENLKQSHADWLAAAAAVSKAEYEHGIAGNTLKTLNDLNGLK